MKSYNFGFIDEDAKREIRRSLLKALAIPGYQVPYSSREMPMGRGFGTGGLQITLSVITNQDTLKMIDQGSDDSVNAVSLRNFITMTCDGVDTTDRTQNATLIQSRHRIPETKLTEDQIVVLQVPLPDPLWVVEPQDEKRRVMHSEFDYARLWVKLYEDVKDYDEITIAACYPTMINDGYVIDPSPIPRWDVPKLNNSPCPILLGAGREKRIYAVPPYTKAEPLSFDDICFKVEDFKDRNGVRYICSRCGAENTYLEEFNDAAGNKIHQCSDTDYCNQQLEKNA